MAGATNCKVAAANCNGSGFTVTSRWIDLREEVAADAAKCAAIDHEDLDLADVLIAFGEEPRSTRSRGGRHVEFGYALAQRKQIILIAHRENVFAFLSLVEFYPTWQEALRVLAPQQRLAARLAKA